MAWITDKRVVITGATSGIGRHVANSLASRGAHVVLACRNRDRAHRVAADINTGCGERRAEVMIVDTSDPRSIDEFVARYASTYGVLDILVNNAGLLVTERQTTEDGIELTFATNVLGYHLVTAGLRPALEAATSSRVINVASTFAFGVDLDDLQFERRAYDGLAAYAQSKACDRLLTWALARRFDGSSTTVNAMAPGLMLGTNLYRRLPAETVQELERYGSRTIADGADTLTWLASSPELEGVHDRFFENRAEVPCELRDEDTEERLWQRCVRTSEQLRAAR